MQRSRRYYLRLLPAYLGGLIIDVSSKLLLLTALTRALLTMLALLTLPGVRLLLLASLATARLPALVIRHVPALLLPDISRFVVAVIRLICHQKFSC